MTFAEVEALKAQQFLAFGAASRKFGVGPVEAAVVAGAGWREACAGSKGRPSSGPVDADGDA